MASKETTKYCKNCDERTVWYIETNDETGWRRERCQECMVI